MKRSFQFLLLTGMFVILGMSAFAQGSAGWKIVLNHDNSPFTMHIYNDEMTFFFNAKSDTLCFSLSNGKPIKDNFTIEVTLRNSKKALFTSTEKNMAAGKTQIVVPMGDVLKAATGQKLPAKPKYTISVMDKTTVKEKIDFEFKE